MTGSFQPEATRSDTQGSGAAALLPFAMCIYMKMEFDKRKTMWYNCGNEYMTIHTWTYTQ